MSNVERMCLALLREWEGEFRRHEDGIDGGECSTIDFSRCLFYVITEVCKGTGACGKQRDRCGDPSVEILLLTTFRFIDGKLLLRGRPLIERLLEQTSSRQPLFDPYCTTVSFIWIMHNPAYLVHHGSTTTKHLK